MKNKTVKKRLALMILTAAIITMPTACDNELDIKQAYGFDLVMMPVQKQIAVGETAEIRCTLVREGEYNGVGFTIRYFQPDGKGELRMDDGTLFAPNDRYPLERTAFRLYYTSLGTDRQTIDLYVEDSFGQVVQKSFSFSNTGVTGNEETE